MVQWEYLVVSTAAIGSDATSNLAAIAAIDLPTKGIAEWAVASTIFVPDATPANSRIIFVFKRPVDDRP